MQRRKLHFKATKITFIHTNGKAVAKYYQGDQITKNEMCGACGTYGGEERRTQCFVFIITSHSHTRFTRSPCFRLFFCLTPSCQYTAVLNLRPIIFGLTPFGWVRSITLNPTYSIISYGNIFDLRLFYLRPLFQEHNYTIKRGIGRINFLYFSM
jgi:hypothetical protein